MQLVCGVRFFCYGIKRTEIIRNYDLHIFSRAGVVHLNLRAGSTFPRPVCTASPGLWVNKEEVRFLFVVYEQFFKSLFIILINKSSKIYPKVRHV